MHGKGFVRHKFKHGFSIMITLLNQVTLKEKAVSSYQYVKESCIFWVVHVRKECGMIEYLWKIYSFTIIKLY